MSVSQGVRRVRERIADATLRSGRPPDTVALVGCKPGSIEQVLEAVDCGLTDIGENRVQEAAVKVAAVAQRAATPVHWHLIGHLQTNKVKAALQIFDTIQSVDSMHLIEKLSDVASRPRPGPVLPPRGTADGEGISSLRAFLEVQFAHTPDRFGFTPDTAEVAFDTIAALPEIDVVGLMTVAPLGLDTTGARNIFRSLREIRDLIQQTHPALPPIGLSMGMTDDYEIAIEEGATVVRIGRAIFSA